MSGWDGRNWGTRQSGGYNRWRRNVSVDMERDGPRDFFSFSPVPCTERAFWTWSSYRSKCGVWRQSDTPVTWSGAYLRPAPHPAWDELRSLPTSRHRRKSCARLPPPVALSVTRSRVAKHSGLRTRHERRRQGPKPTPLGESYACTTGSSHLGMVVPTTQPDGPRGHLLAVPHGSHPMVVRDAYARCAFTDSDAWRRRHSVRAADMELTSSVAAISSSATKKGKKWRVMGQTGAGVSTGGCAECDVRGLKLMDTAQRRPRSGTTWWHSDPKGVTEKQGRASRTKRTLDVSQ